MMKISSNSEMVTRENSLNLVKLAWNYPFLKISIRGEGIKYLAYLRSTYVHALWMATSLLHFYRAFFSATSTTKITVTIANGCKPLTKVTKNPSQMLQWFKMCLISHIVMVC